MYCPLCYSNLSSPEAGYFRCPNCTYEYRYESKALGAVLPEVKAGGLVLETDVKNSIWNKKLAIAACAAILLLGGGVVSFNLITSGQNAAKNTPQVSEPQPEVMGESDTLPAEPTTPVDNPEPAPAPVETPPAPAPAPKVVAKPKPAPAPAIPTPPGCVKNTGFKAADAAPISTSVPGLKFINELPEYYRVYGYTPEQVRVQLNQCSPVESMGFGKHDSVTTWWLNFTYNKTPTSGGKCKVIGAAVGLHMKRVFPTWSPSPYDSAGLATKWQSYTNALGVHDQGHVDIAKKYAGELLSNLKNFPETSCTTIYQVANNMGNAKIAAHNQAQAAYDTQTQYGKTQGAIFP